MPVINIIFACYKIVENNLSCKSEYKKHRISESSRANTFLSATHFFQDDVFNRTCDLQDENAIFGADIYYHYLHD